MIKNDIKLPDGELLIIIIKMYPLLALVCALAFTFHYLSRINQYWKKRGVPNPKPSLLVGNYGDYILLKKNLPQTVDDLCRKFPDQPLVAAMYGTQPVIIPKDPELIKLITTKDFYYFSSRELTGYTHREPLTKNLFCENGNYWKVLRQNLTPLFSSAKMKKMFPLIVNCTEVFEKLLENEIKCKPEHEVRDIISRFTIDCVVSCVFGVEANAMANNAEKNPFKVIAGALLNFSSIRSFMLTVRSIWPQVFYGVGFKAFNRTISDFFNGLLTGVFRQRGYKPSSRHDFVDLILSFKEKNYIVGDSLKNTKFDNVLKEKIKLKVDDEVLIAQCGVFFTAGFETSANTLSYSLYELAKNEEAQSRAYKEVVYFLNRHDGKVTYDCISEMPYLEACMDEALRLYPVLGCLSREVIEDYTLPSGLCLEKGVRVHLPVYHMHHNPDFFPDPEEYRPERFLPDQKEHIKPYTYLPFGEGPRICIGMRFAKMQVLAGLITVLKKYKLVLAEGMPRNIEFEPRSAVMQSTCGINLKFVPRNHVNELAVNTNNSVIIRL